jgi:hypothetical protein
VLIAKISCRKTDAQWLQARWGMRAVNLRILGERGVPQTGKPDSE